MRVSSLLQSLAPGTRWHYRLVARSSAGTSTGANASFATPPRPLDALGRPVRCTIVGTQGADVIRGTTRRDVICGLGGNDTILGRGGDDVIYGGPGADVINGGLGHDRIFGGGGNDTIHVRDGRRDAVAGGPGNDLAIVDQRLDRLTSVERRRTH
jgi:Ca2+-binding RTX toxin-like protein